VFLHFFGLKISVFALKTSLKTLIFRQKNAKTLIVVSMLSQCCLWEFGRVFLTTWRYSFRFSLVSLWCPDVVSMLFAETTLGQHFFLEVVFGLFVCSSVFFLWCPDVVSMLSPETIFRQHWLLAAILPVC
jgi:hypothetical protein